MEKASVVLDDTARLPLYEEKNDPVSIEIDKSVVGVAVE